MVAINCNKKSDHPLALVITTGFFPYGNAMASRMRAFCKMFASAGYRVHVITLFTKQLSDPSCDIHVCDNCTYEIASKGPARSIDSFIGNHAMKQHIRQFIKSNAVDFIFSDGCQCYFDLISAYAKRNSIPYYIEQCEKYDVSSYKFGCFDIRRWYYLYLYKRGYMCASGVVAISRLLEKHYRDLNIKTIRIPTILDIDNTDFRTEASTGKIKLVYTGVAWGHKELLAPIIWAFTYDHDLAQKYEFHVYGTSETQLLDDEPSLEIVLQKLRNTVFFHGTIDQREIPNILKNSDYQIFLRPHRESSEAGFPTKLGESMAAGTPVITNITGDIGLYLTDGQNGYILPDTSVNSVRDILTKLQNLPVEQRTSMRQCARHTAETVFNYKTYTDEIKRFLCDT